MEEPWKILFYSTPQGNFPVKEFIDSLETKLQTKVHNTIDLLSNFGTTTGSPHIKKLAGTNLWELRILGTDNIRILYIAIIGRTFLLLHGFKKKKDKTPPKDLKTALVRLQEHKTRF